MENKGTFNPRTLLAMALVLGFWIFWQHRMAQKYPEPLKSAQSGVVSGPQTTETGTAGQVNKNVPKKTTVQAEGRAHPEQIVSYDDSLRHLSFSSTGGRLSEFVLKKFKNKKNETFTMFESGGGALLVTLDGLPEEKAKNAYYEIEKATDTQFVMTGNIEGVQVTKTVTLDPNSYAMDVVVALSGDTTKVQRVNVSVEEALIEAPKASGFFSFLQRPSVENPEFFFSFGTKEKRKIVSYSDKGAENYDASRTAALSFRYFSNAIVNKASVIPDGREVVSDGRAQLVMSYPVLDRSSSPRIPFTLYTGPKEIETLKTLGKDVEKIVDLGMFSWLGYPMLSIMRLFFSIFGNWGVAIILLTLLVRLVTFPFVYTSMRSMKGMQKIQPEIARIKERYKNDKAKLNQEMLVLMRENKVNPMGGCLPMLLQIPVFLALWMVLQNSIELYQAPFTLWITDLSSPDRFYVLPVLMSLTMYIQQRITPNTTMDPDQARVMRLMPVIFGLFMFNTPSGLTLYLFVSTLFGIIQQRFIMADRGNEKQAKPVKA